MQHKGDGNSKSQVILSKLPTFYALKQTLECCPHLCGNMPKGKKYSAAKIKMWYNEKAGSEETETAANHDRLKKGQAKQTDDETKIY